MNKQPEVTAQTKQNLINAFWILYCEKHIEKISVKEITAKAGYNRSTFYEYFTDVFDVLVQIENLLLPTIDELPPINISLQEISLPINSFIKLFEEHSQYYTVLLGDNGDPSFQSKLKNSIKPMLKQKATLMGVKDDYELDYILEYMLSAMIGILSYWFRQSNPPPAEKLIELMYDLLQNGITKKLPFIENNVLY